jgi:hypothetical protein
MKALNPALVRTVTYSMAGARRAKFEASIKILNDSLAQGGWVTRGSVKAQSGFYQGLTSKLSEGGGFELFMTLRFGQSYRINAEVTDQDFHKSGVSPEVGRAWVALCKQAQEARKELDASRPLPKITKIGLSPKVTKTLTECNLDLDLPSIKMAKIDFFLVPSLTKGTREPMLDRDGKPVMERVYFVKWTPGIKHMQSRFSGYGGCEACGKAIPSGRYVPVEATCKKLGLVALWLGCDCAANIFGIKDVGIAKTESKT